MRLPWTALAAGTVVAAVGAAGLIRGAVPQSSAAGSNTTSAAGPIVVTGAYVRAPVPPTKVAAAYFTVYNTTGQDDRLTSVQSGAGAVAQLHTLAADGSMNVSPGGVVIHAHGSLTLSVGKGHVMIEHLYGTLRKGDTVDLVLNFQNAGPIEVPAPVIGISDPAPDGGH